MRWWSISAKPIHDEKGQLAGWRGVASDITEARLHGNDAVRAARTDPLTGLANRLLVRELLEEAVLHQWDSRAGCALLLVDLDRFKLVNDTLGHAIGDHCWSKSVGGSSRRSARAAGSGASAATNSPWCGAGLATVSSWAPWPTASWPTCPRASPSARRRFMSGRPSASPSARMTARSRKN